jgi:polygalacturonase
VIFEEWCSAALSASAGGYLLTVVDYGAEGDGVADDREAIQLAIDVMNETHLPCAFPKGDFALKKKGRR